MAKSKSIMVATPLARLSFPKLKNPERYEDQAPKFSADLLFGPGSSVKKLKDVAQEVAAARWGDDLPKNLRSPFKDGADKAGLDGYGEGVTFLTVKNEKRPTCVYRDKTLIPVEEIEDVLYPGCYVYAVLSCYSYDKKGNKGVTFSLKTVQFAKDGDSFAGGSGLDLLDSIEEEGEVLGEEGDENQSPW